MSSLPQNAGELSHNVSEFNFVIGLVCSRFNSAVTYPMRDCCIERLMSRGIIDSRLLQLSVPGSLEISYALSLLAHKPEKPDVLIAIGAVIRGETFHFDVVALQSAASLYNIQNELAIPVVNGIATTNNLQQAQDRIKKGSDYADCALEMAYLRRCHVGF